jgi:hypothetical protein
MNCSRYYSMHHCVACQLQCDSCNLRSVRPACKWFCHQEAPAESAVVHRGKLSHPIASDGATLLDVTKAICERPCQPRPGRNWKASTDLTVDSTGNEKLRSPNAPLFKLSNGLAGPRAFPSTSRNRHADHDENTQSTPSTRRHGR